MSDFTTTLEDAGGLEAPMARTAQLKTLLDAELGRGRAELNEPRSGYDQPVLVAIAAGPTTLVALVPVDPQVRVDPAVADERSWLLVAAVVGALVDVGAESVPEAADYGGHLLLETRIDIDPDPELAALAFSEHVAPVDRLRAVAVAVPPALFDPEPETRPAVGEPHPFAVAFHVARFGGRPADSRDADRLEEEVLAQILPTGTFTGTRPHDDPDPARRVARRILQRLDGMGKWGGYHTEFAHLARGFAPEDRDRAAATGEALLKAGLLKEKPSVGQRHVFLDPSRKADIMRLVDDGVVPNGLALP